MPPFYLEANGADLCLHLTGELTIEHARELHTALVATVMPGTRLRLDAREVTRVDAAVLQLLIAAAHPTLETKIAAASAAWHQALARFGLDASAFTPSRPA